MKNKDIRVCIKVNNLQEKLAAVKFLAGFYDVPANARVLENIKNGTGMSHIYVARDSEEITAYGHALGCNAYTVSDMWKIYTMNSPVEVKLNSEYSATIFPDKITVGCQTIPESAVDELVKAWQNRKS